MIHLNVEYIKQHYNIFHYGIALSASIAILWCREWQHKHGAFWFIMRLNDIQTVK